MAAADVSTFADTIGTVVSFTVIRVPTPEFAQEAPYGLVVIETADGERLLARVLEPDAEQLAIGASVIYDHSDDHGAVFRLK